MGEIAVQRWQLWPDEPRGSAIVLPGAGYTIDHPILWWTCMMLAEQGWAVVGVRWELDEAARADPERFAARAAKAALAEAPALGKRLVVGKSFGTWAAPWATQESIPGVWLTPILTRPPLVAALTQTSAPGLLVGGSADQLWDDDIARATGMEVVRVDGADHILYLPQGWRASYDGLGEVIARVQDFTADLHPPR